MRKKNGVGRREGNYSQATRVLRLANQLRRHHGLTFAELADDFQVTERQMKRDLAALEAAGYALDYQTGDDRRVRVRLADVKPGVINLGVSERYTLLAVRRVFDVLRDTSFYEDVESIYEKVAAALPESERKHMETLGGRFVYLPDGGTKAYRSKQDVLDALLTGVVRRHRVRYRYKAAAGEASSGVMEPYAMVLYRHGLYVIAHALDGTEGKPADGADGKTSTGAGSRQRSPARRSRRDPHIYAAERFTAAEFIRDQTFELPPGFRVDDYFEGAFGIFVAGQGVRRPHRVVVDFTPEARPYVEARSWHRTQKTAPLRGGGVRVTFDVAHLAEVLPWIRAWGDMAHVRGPAALATEIGASLGKAARQYRRGGVAARE